jgi:cold shock CspA family protein
MGRHHCDTCGEQFNNRMNLELHEDLVDCAPDTAASADATPSTATDDSSMPDADSLPATATGTVSSYNDDRGFGFVTTGDLTREQADGTETTTDVFFHISDLPVASVETGDRLQFSIVETDDGFRCADVELLKRDRNRDSYEQPEDDSAKLGFGQQTTDKKYGHGKTSPTDSEIESFQDERKFR